MAFQADSIECKTFTDLGSLEKYVQDEEKRYALVPICNFYENHAQFSDDKYYGNRKQWIRFNEYGFKALCSLTKIPYKFISELQEPELTTRVLNDQLRRHEIQKTLNNYQFVLDQETMTVAGVVSYTYLAYSNSTFIKHLKECFPDIISSFEITTSYSINTNLYIRMLSPKMQAGIIRGRGGTDKDISRVGFQLSNSMVGTKSIKADFFVLRLICANGLVLPSTSHSGIVNHRGKPETFKKRLEENITPIFKNIKSSIKLIEEIGNIQYDVEKLVDEGGAEKVYNIIQLNYWDSIKRGKLKGNDLRKFDIDKISQYPTLYGGDITKNIFGSYFRDNHSMFDFINVFTEHAKEKVGQARIDIERESGVLANWIFKNKKKFI